MDTELRRDENDESWDLGGTYIAPSSKVRLPDDVTKLRKRSRGGGPVDPADEREV